MRRINSQNGFVALFSSVIISFVLLLMAVNLNFIGFYGRFNILESEFKERSNGVALACIESVRLTLATNTSYAGNGNISVGSSTCSYVVTNTGGLATVVASASVNNAHTYYKTILNTNTPKITATYFEELLTYP
jgi:hypothetical protein